MAQPRTPKLKPGEVDDAYAAGYKCGWDQPDEQGTDLKPFTTLHEVWWLGWRHGMTARRRAVEHKLVDRKINADLRRIRRRVESGEEPAIFVN